MTKSIVGMALGLAFMAGIRLMQGSISPLVVAIGFAVYALFEERINRKMSDWADRILRRMNP